MHPHHCINCENELRAEDIYCSKCSQRSNTHQLTIGHLAHELFHSVTHADKGLLLLVKKLAMQPGTVAREYAAGRRKAYFSPFSFLLLCLSLLVFMNSLFPVAHAITQPDENILKHLPTAAARESYLHMLERTALATDVLVHKANFVYLVAIPFYALLFWAFFRRKTYAEHLVANMYFNGFLALATSLLVNPLLTLMHIKTSSITTVCLLFSIQILYLTWGYYGFLNGKRKRLLAKIIPVALLVLFLWTILTGIGFFIYVYRDHAGQVIASIAKAYASTKK